MASHIFVKIASGHDEWPVRGEAITCTIAALLLIEPFGEIRIKSLNPSKDMHLKLSSPNFKHFVETGYSGLNIHNMHATSWQTAEVGHDCICWCPST